MWFPLKAPEDSNLSLITHFNISVFTNKTQRRIPLGYVLYLVYTIRSMFFIKTINESGGMDELTIINNILNTILLTYTIFYKPKFIYFWTKK